MPLGWVVTRKVGKVLLALEKVGDFFFGKVAKVSLLLQVDCRKNIQHRWYCVVRMYVYLFRKNTSFVTKFDDSYSALKYKKV